MHGPVTAAPHRTIAGVRLTAADDMVVLASDRHWDGVVFEPESMAFWRHTITPGSLAVDVGAYTGVYSVAAAQEGATVLALEPNRAAFERLCENVALNEVGGSVMCAFGAAGGLAWVRVERRAALSSAAHVVEDVDGDVLRCPLDNMLAGVRDVSAIKIDVEGSELDVIHGAKETIWNHRPHMIIEVLDSEAEGYIRDRLTYYGYQITHADGRNLLCSP